MTAVGKITYGLSIISLISPDRYAAALHSTSISCPLDFYCPAAAPVQLPLAPRPVQLSHPYLPSHVSIPPGRDASHGLSERNPKEREGEGRKEQEDGRGDRSGD